METKTFVLSNIPEVDDVHDYLIDFLEAVLEKSVDNVCFHPGVPRRALVTMREDIDLSDAFFTIDENLFNGKVLAVEQGEPNCFVIVEREDYAHELTLSSLQHYFETEVIDGDETVSKCLPIPHSAMVALSFSDTTVADRILEQGSLVLQVIDEEHKIQLKPFFNNFHGQIPYAGKLLCEVLEEENDFDILTKNEDSCEHDPMQVNPQGDSHSKEVHRKSKRKNYNKKRNHDHERRDLQEGAHLNENSTVNSVGAHAMHPAEPKEYSMQALKNIL